jgi:hypothetical protein
MEPLRRLIYERPFIKASVSFWVHRDLHFLSEDEAAQSTLMLQLEILIGAIGAAWSAGCGMDIRSLVQVLSLPELLVPVRSLESNHSARC